MPSPINSLKSSRTNVAFAERTLRAEMFAVVKAATFAVDGDDMTLPMLAAIIDEHLAAMTAVDKAREALKLLVAKQGALRKRAKTAIQALQAYVLGRYGVDSKQWLALGFPPKKRRSVSAETRKAAAQKALATRKERKTMGKRQRAKIKGVVAEKRT